MGFFRDFQGFLVRVAGHTGFYGSSLNVEYAVLARFDFPVDFPEVAFLMGTMIFLWPRNSSEQMLQQGLWS